MAAANLESLVQGLVERGLGEPPSSLYEPVKPDIRAAREAARLSAQLWAGREVQHDSSVGAGRLVGLRLQPRPQPPRQHPAAARSAAGVQAESATLWALVQPSTAAELRPSVSVAAGADGLRCVSVEAAADFDRHLGVDASFELEPRGAWGAEAGIAQRLPAVPLTVAHKVKARCSGAGKRERGSIRLTRTTTAAVPLPLSSSEFSASLALPSSMDAGWLLPGGLAAAAAAAPAPPTTTTTSSSDLAAASTASAAAGASTQRRKVTLQLRPRRGRVELGQKSEKGKEEEDSEGGGGGSNGSTSLVPQIKVEAQLPEQGPALRVAARDVACEWRQAWSPRLTSKVGWRHVPAGGRSKSSGQLPGAEASGRSGSAWRLGWPSTARLASSSSWLGGLAGRSTASLGGALAAAGAAAATTPQLQCDLTCRLAGGRLTLGGGTALDLARAFPSAAAEGGSGSSSSMGRWLARAVPSSASLLAAAKQGRLKLKLKMGGKGGSKGASSGGSNGSKGAAAAVGGRGQGPAPPGSLSLQSSLGSGCHTLVWRRGGKPGAWDDGQRMRSELSLRFQPAASLSRSLRLDFDVFLPLG